MAEARTKEINDLIKGLMQDGKKTSVHLGAIFNKTKGWWWQNSDIQVDFTDWNPEYPKDPTYQAFEDGGTLYSKMQFLHGDEYRWYYQNDNDKRAYVHQRQGKQ